MNYISIDTKLYERIENLTGTSYEGIKREDDVLVSTDNLIGMLESLAIEVDIRQEQVDDLKQDLQDNYRPLTPSEMGWE